MHGKSTRRIFSLTALAAYIEVHFIEVNFNEMNFNFMSIIKSIKTDKSITIFLRLSHQKPPNSYRIFQVRIEI